MASQFRDDWEASIIISGRDLIYIGSNIRIEVEDINIILCQPGCPQRLVERP